MARWMVTLVGEQPMPVYSLIREPELRPDWVLFVASERTHEIVKRIRPLLNDIPTEACIVAPYSIDDVITKLHAELAAVSPDDTVIFNLTGGTKTMVFGAMEVARQREAEIVYLKSETDTQVFRYRISQSGIEEIDPMNATQPVPLADFLTIHIGRIDEGNTGADSETNRDDERGRVFEREVQSALLGDSRLDEVKFMIRAQELGGLELDFVVRLGHSYGIGSLKSGNLRKKESQAVEEIASESRYFGPYVRRFLVVSKVLSDGTNKLCNANNVIPIELLSFAEQQRLSDDDRAKLVDTIVAEMQPGKR